VDFKEFGMNKKNLLIAIIIIMSFILCGFYIRVLKTHKMNSRLDAICLNPILQKQDVELAAQLLRDGANPNYNSYPSFPLLMKVLQWNNIKSDSNAKSLFKLLLEHGADPNISDEDKYYPLGMVPGDLGAEQLLIKYGDQVSTPQHGGILNAYENALNNYKTHKNGSSEEEVLLLNNALMNENPQK